MKRIFCLLLALAMMTAFAACSNAADLSADDDKETTAQSGDKTHGEKPEDNKPGFCVEVTENVVRNYKPAAEKDFAYREVAGGICISKYLGNDVIVVIPDKIEGQPVVEMDGLIFANESPVRGVYIPNTVKTLDTTFGNNENIEVVICEGVEEVLENTFLNCPRLHTVNLGDSLKELGSLAFAGCASLTKLYVAPSLTEIDPDIAAMVFFSCDKLTIKGEAGSYIETFCGEQNIPFETV